MGSIPWRVYRVIGVLGRRNSAARRRPAARNFSGQSHGASLGSSDGSSYGGGSGSSNGSAVLRMVPGATVATLLMLGALHARRMYEDNKLEKQRLEGQELQFEADWKATFLQVLNGFSLILPLRFISRRWGELTSVELPMWLRPYVYKGWARAFNSNLEEASKPIEEYPSLQAFFTRELKEGARPLAIGPTNLISPVDAIVIRCGQIQGSGTMIEQVKGFSYSLSALLGALPQLSGTKIVTESEKDQTLTIASPTSKESGSQKMKLTRNLGEPLKSVKGLFYCVLYLGPGAYHRIHAPSDWKICLRRHFAGKLCPVNDRAVRTMKNLYVVNERVVLEGEWSQGLMAMAAVGATNVGSIEIKLEPELKTNLPLFGKELQSIVTMQKYGSNGEGYNVNAGDEVALFNLGSTVVLVFEAPVGESEGGKQGFSFMLEKGQHVKMGELIGHW